jgi:hypothetical protein
MSASAVPPAAVPPAAASAAAEPLFREHLLPGVGTWVVGIAIGAALGLVVVPLHLGAAIALSVVSIAIAIVLIIASSPVHEVADGRFRLGRARIEVELLGEPEVQRGEQWALTIGQDFEPLAHHSVRGWTRSGLRVEVLDPQDPTTAWVASTRRPEDLALALRTAQQQARRAGGQGAADTADPPAGS